MSDEVFVVASEITDELGERLLAWLWKVCNKDYAPMSRRVILINSGGGDGDLVLAASEIIKRSVVDIHTFCIGKAFSAAAMLLMAGTKGYRYIVPAGEVMIHAGQYDLSIPAGSCAQTMQYVVRQRNKLETFYTENCSASPEQLREWLKVDTYFTAEECVEEGIADAMVSLLPV